MAKQNINVGTTANDKKGDSLRAAFQKVNANFTELYTALGINADVNLNIGAFEFTGSTLSTTDSTPIVIDQATTITSNLTVGGDILPSVANDVDLGSSTLPWRSLYVSQSTIYLGGIALSVDASGNLLVDGSLVTGGGGSSVTTSSTAPANPSLGDLWYDTASGRTYVYYDASWVDASPVDGVGITSYNDLTNKPTLFSGSYNDLTNKPNLGGTYQFSVAADDSTQRLISADEVIKFIGAGGVTTASDAEGNITITGVSIPSQTNNANKYLTTDGTTLRWDNLSNSMYAGGPGGTRWEFEELSDDNGATYYGRINFPDGTSQNTAWTGSAQNIASESDVSIQINLTDSTAQIWRFGEDGDLRFPSGLQIGGSNGNTEITNTGSLYIVNTGLNQLVVEWSAGNNQLPDGVDVKNAGITAGPNGLSIGLTNRADVSHSWGFNGNGSLDIPGDIRSNSNINIDINIGDSTLRRWSFGEDGALTFPDGTNQTGKSVTVPMDQVFDFNLSFTNPPESTRKITIGQYGLITDNTVWQFETADSKHWNFNSEEQSIETSESTGCIKFGTATKDNTGAYTDIELFSFGTGDGTNAVYISAGGSPTNNRWKFGGDGALTLPGDIRSNSNINIDINLADSTLRRWQFGEDGNLTLPSGGTISEGGGLTGAIRLTPAGGANEYQALVIYPTANPDGDHLHLTAGGGSTELYLGDDYHYVKLVDGGDVEVQADSGVATATWTFDTDGNIDAQQALGIKVPNGVPSSVTEINNTTGYWEMNPRSNLATMGGSGTGLTVNVTETGGYASAIAIATAGTGYTSGDVITVVSGTSTANFTIAVAGRNTWTFGTGGDLTLPYNAVLRNTVGDAIAFGNGAGQNSQGGEAVAIGTNAGYDSQGADAVAIGTSAGETDQGEKAVAIGDSAGYIDQGDYAVAIGHGAGNGTQGSYAVAIGMSAGETAQAANSIVINATGATLNQTTANTFTVAPIRNIIGTDGVLQYNATTKEVSYSNSVTAESFNTDQITVVGNRITTTVTNANLELECNGTGGVVINTVAEATTASTARSAGYLGIPASAVTTTATLTISDAGEHIYLTTTGQTITIPAAASVAYPIGTTLTFIAGPSATTTTIAITSDTLRLAGSTSTGSRTLAANGMATAVKVASTTWYINGVGLT
jgi:hypothetical protein